MHRWVYTLTILMLSSHVFAGNNIWTSHGPFRSYFNHIEFARNNPNIVFALSGSELLRSTDSGFTWKHLNFPSNYGYPTTLRVHPKNSNIVFGIAESVFISRNRGTTWQKISHHPFGGINLNLYDLEFDPTDPEILYGVTKGYYGKQIFPQRVYKSTDGGKTWSAIFGSTCCADTQVQNIEIDQQNGKRVYVTFNNGFFRSTDGGKKFEQVKTGKPNPFVSLKIDPSNGRQLYAASYKALYKTTDGGTTWSFAGTKCGPNISIDPKNPRIIYSVGKPRYPCGVKSQDGGASWQPLSFPHLTPTDDLGAIAVNPAKPNLILVSSDLLYRSANAGRSWITITNGKGTLSGSVVINSKSVPDVYAFDYNRLFASFANGKWRLLRTPQTFGINTLLISAKDPSMLIAGGAHIPFTSTPDESLIVSFDSGMTWQYRTGPFSWVQDLIMDPHDSNKLYAAGGGITVTIGRSSDFGKTWETIVTNAYASYSNIRIDPMNPSLLYASSADGLLRSTNSGKSWARYGNAPSGNIRSMDLAPKHIYLLMEDPLAESNTNLIYRSDDRGLSFQLKNQGVPKNNLYFVKVHPTNPSIVFVGTDKGLFISNNDGGSWTLFETAGLPQNRAIGSLTIPLSNPNQYFVSAFQGVFSYTKK